MCHGDHSGVCVAISLNLQWNPINHHYRCFCTWHGDDAHPFFLFVLAAETPLIHRFDLSCGADHLWSEIGAISLITNRLLSIIGVRRHWGLVQQPWTSMWAPLPCPHLVYMLFSINCEPQSKFDRIPTKFPPNCVVVRFGQRCCWRSAFMISVDPISSMINPLTITSLIYLHTSLQNFIARDFKMKDISSSFYCLLSLLFQQRSPLFGSVVSHNTLVKSSNPSYSMCLLFLHMPLQSFMSIGSNMQEKWSYLLITVPAAPQQSSC